MMRKNERIRCENEDKGPKYDPSGRTMRKDGYEVLDHASTSRDFPHRRDMRARDTVPSYPIPYGNED